MSNVKHSVESEGDKPRDHADSRRPIGGDRIVIGARGAVILMIALILEPLLTQLKD